MKSVDIEKNLVSIEKQVSTMTIKTDSERLKAIDLLKIVKAKRIEIVAFFKDSKEKAHAAWKAVVANEKSFTDKLDTYETTAKKAIAFFDNEKERLRLIEEKKLQEKAEADAERERKALANRAARTKDEEKREVLLNQAEAVAPVMVSLPSSVRKAEGESKAKVWKFRIIDVSKIPREFMIPNEVMLGALARNAKELAKVDGIEFYSEDSLRIKI